MAGPDLEPKPFRWEDGERVIRFGRGALAHVAEEVGVDYVLLTTPRGRERAPALVERATTVHDVPAGRVDELAAGLRGAVAGDTLLALGGGRAVDASQAPAAARPPRGGAPRPPT